MLKFFKPQNLSSKYFSTVKNWLFAECLKERSLLQLNGNDAKIYLQGLVTNDMCHLQGSASSIFTMFLNSRGRVLYDSLIYNSEKESTYLIECDKDGCLSLKDHLLKFKVRRKVNISFLENELDIWTVVHNQSIINPSDVFDYKEILDLIQKNLPNVIASKDPRLSCLGLRLITPKNFNIYEELEKKIGVKIQQGNFYKLHRYKLGIGEGMKELPPEKCLPMEANGDYLNGISFHKGCYLGQELTARTYHTGVIRKRLMPLIFQEDLKHSELGIPIFPVPISDKPIGKLQGIEKTAGVGLLRIDEALRANELVILETKCITHRPFWWPVEAPKERIKIG